MPHENVIHLDRRESDVCGREDEYSIETLEVTSRPMQSMRREACRSTATQEKEVFARQRLMPAWDQSRLAEQRIVILGLGGNGGHVLQTLIAIGAAARGWIAGVDPDVLEASNLPRIPYAMPTDIGRAKVDVAADHAKSKNPDVHFRAIRGKAGDAAAKAAMSAATVILGCGDNDGLRKIANEAGIRYGVPYIDLGCDIQMDGDRLEAGGQVRVVVPGETACLVCCGGFDPAKAALDLLADDQRAVYEQRGYLIGDRNRPTPSVATLNALTAQFGITALLGLLHPRFVRWSYLHFDWLTGKMVVARSEPVPHCPACGTDARRDDVPAVPSIPPAPSAAPPISSNTSGVVDRGETEARGAVGGQKEVFNHRGAHVD